KIKVFEQYLMQLNTFIVFKMKSKITTLAVLCCLIGSNSFATTKGNKSQLIINSSKYQVTKNLSISDLNEQDTIISKKELRRIKKEQRKKMYKDLKFKIGDGVTVTTGPMKGMYGVFIYYDSKMKYLIRFTGTQQMFFNEEDIQLWIEYIKKNK